MKELKITQGKIVLVDKEDYEKVSKYKWSYNKNNRWAQRSFMKEGKKTSTTLHRFLMDAPAHLQVDHINGNRLDNRRSNLRLCSISENQMNKKKNKGSTSKYKGVHLQKSNRHITSKFISKIQVDKKKKTLGYFLTEKEAAIAYNEAAKKYHGEYANLNKVDDEMDFTQYQLLSGRTIPKQKHWNSNVTNFSMGIAGESGEIIDYLKKVLYHGHELDKKHLEKELGDLLWYMSALATINNINLEDVAIGNVEKLKKRYPNGFSESDSINRVE